MRDIIIIAAGALAVGGAAVLLMPVVPVASVKPMKPTLTMTFEQARQQQR